jgi:two-component system, OmpR family, response regulator ResD
MTVPLIQATRPRIIDRRQLTAKEVILLDYFQAHPDQVCEKDDLIRAVWPEDRIFRQGVRDDSLAQLVKRLRGKIEPDPANPRLILTVPGRGYEYQGNR